MKKHTPLCAQPAYADHWNKI